MTGKLLFDKLWSHCWKIQLGTELQNYNGFGRAYKDEKWQVKTWWKDIGNIHGIVWIINISGIAWKANILGIA